MVFPPKKVRLGIVGAGPKALAIAAKAKVLSLVGFHVPEIIIFEKKGVGHHWTEDSGYTNGKLSLGTSADKDVGFPYYSFCWGDFLNPLVNKLMQQFSWASFQIGDHSFAGWIDRGRPSPTHRRWADYLNWVYKKLRHDVTLINGCVEEIDIADGVWRVKSVNSDANVTHTLVDAVVATGPGNTNLPTPLPAHPNILKTENFWLNFSDYLSLKNCAVALIGAGENAATVAVTLGKIHESIRIDIISPNAMNYTRGESYVENHIYTDPFKGNWHLFSQSDRKNFISRTDRGVFSVDTKKELDCLPNVEVIPGECKNLSIDSLNQIILDVRYNNTQENRIYDMVVVTTGFDHATFVTDLLTTNAKNYILANSSLPSLTRDALQDSISETLAIEDLTPALHLPMLAGLRQGPGFPNLSCLGRLSDHILSHHVPLKSCAVDERAILSLILDKHHCAS
jgi:mycobactin lysine-N-oxygenase